MEALRLLAVLLVVAFVQVLGALGTPLSSEEEDVWTVEGWQGYPLDRGMIIRLADLSKRSKSQEFHGLMGRSSDSGTPQPLRLGRKRNRGEMFVGLMGKRGFDGGLEEDWKSESY